LYTSMRKVLLLKGEDCQFGLILGYLTPLLLVMIVIECLDR